MNSKPVLSEGFLPSSLTVLLIVFWETVLCFSGIAWYRWTSVRSPSRSPDALGNSREGHLCALTLGPGSAGLGLNAALRADPGEQEIVSFWPAWSSGISSGRTGGPGRRTLPSHALPTGLASWGISGDSPGRSGVKEACPENRAESKPFSRLFPPSWGERCASLGPVRAQGL